MKNAFNSNLFLSSWSDASSPSIKSRALGWTGTPTPMGSIAQDRLRVIRSLVGTNVWRTEKLSTPTVDAAVDFVLLFEAALMFAMKPRVAPTDDGGILFEWEHSDRELHVEVRPGGRLEILQVKAGEDVFEGEVPTSNANRLATWLQS